VTDIEQKWTRKISTCLSSFVI